jgi:hypothetical protein
VIHQLIHPPTDPSSVEEKSMLTDDDVIADLSRLRERGADIQYTREVPLTRRSVAATVAPVAAVAAVATLGATAVIGAGDHGPGTNGGSRGSTGGTSSAGAAQSGPTGGTATPTAIKLVSAKITLGGKTIAYRHAVGEDPFGGGWQLAIDYGSSLPAGATRYDLGHGELAWVADSSDPSVGASVLIVAAGPHDYYYGAPSSYSRADLEEFVRTQLHGQ